MNALIVKSNTVVNLVVCDQLSDVPLSKGETITEAPEGVGIGWSKTSSGWEPPPSEPEGPSLQDQIALQAQQIQALTLALLTRPI